MVELKLANTKTSQNHERRRDRDDDRELPGKDEANEAWEEKTESCLNGDTHTFSRQTVNRADVLSNYVRQDTWGSIFVVEPTNILPEDCSEQFNS